MNREINQSTMLGKAVQSILLLVGRIVGYIPALIYEYIYSEYFTKQIHLTRRATYRLIGERNKDSRLSAVLDVGTATGHPLLSIVHNFANAHVVGIDINSSYLAACTKLFQPYPNVEIKQLNYYELEGAYPAKKFDLIIFGSSFMLMPDQIKAINLAKDKLAKNGKMYFLLTLYDEKNWFNRIMGLVKPYLKYLSTVDFGQVTYKHEFESFLGEHKLEATLRSRCQGNFFLKYFKFYIYEVRRMEA